MPLVKGKIKGLLVNFLESANSSKKSDTKKAVEAYAEEMESIIYEAIKDITITIPSGMVIVSGSAVTQTNLAPIVLTGTIK